MSSSPEHRTRLERYARELAALGFPTRLAPAGDERPYDVLLVGIENEAGDPPAWQMELSFVPGMEEQLEGSSLAQCFVGLPVEVAAGAVPELQRTVVTLNRQLPLVGFGHLADPPMACFRHVLMLPRDDGAAAGLVVQCTWLVSYLLSLFAGPVAAVASGDATLREALEGHPHGHLFLP